MLINTHKLTNDTFGLKIIARAHAKAPTPRVLPHKTRVFTRAESSTGISKGRARKLKPRRIKFCDQSTQTCDDGGVDHLSPIEWLNAPQRAALAGSQIDLPEHFIQSFVFDFEDMHYGVLKFISDDIWDELKTPEPDDVSATNGSLMPSTLSTPTTPTTPVTCYRVNYSTVDVMEWLNMIETDEESFKLLCDESIDNISSNLKKPHHIKFTFQSDGLFARGFTDTPLKHDLMRINRLLRNCI